MSLYPCPWLGHLRAFLVGWDALDADARRAAIGAEIVHAGGAWLIPSGGDEWAGHLHEISLYGVCGRGASEAAAIDDWAQAARRIVREHAA